VVSWVVAGLGLFLAAVALALARRLARRLDALTRSYWELRYEYTRLRSWLSRLDPESAAEGAEPADPAPPPPSVTFVPLSAIRKKDK
jgi:hypothetical protein